MADPREVVLELKLLPTPKIIKHVKVAGRNAQNFIGA
jgi:hypothetical protein